MERRENNFAAEEGAGNLTHTYLHIRPTSRFQVRGSGDLKIFGVTNQQGRYSLLESERGLLPHPPLAHDSHALNRRFPAASRSVAGSGTFWKCLAVSVFACMRAFTKDNSCMEIMEKNDYLLQNETTVVWGRLPQELEAEMCQVSVPILFPRPKENLLHSSGKRLRRFTLVLLFANLYR